MGGRLWEPLQLPEFKNLLRRVYPHTYYIFFVFKFFSSSSLSPYKQWDCCSIIISVRREINKFLNSVDPGGRRPKRILNPTPGIKIIRKKKQSTFTYIPIIIYVSMLDFGGVVSESDTHNNTLVPRITVL